MTTDLENTAQLAALTAQVETLTHAVHQMQAILIGTEDNPGVMILLDRLIQRDLAHARLAAAVSYITLGIVLSAVATFTWTAIRHFYL